LKAIIVESHDPRGPYGAKSVGEIGINSVAAAITNAVNAAIGMRLRRLPLTPPRVLEAMLGERDHGRNSSVMSGGNGPRRSGVWIDNV
jgi:hypothetical protein